MKEVHTMTHEQYENLTQHISAVGSDVVDLKIAFKKHFEEDKEWKEDAVPVLKMGKDLQGFGSIAKTIAYIVLTIAALIGSMYAGLSWIKK